MKYQGLVKRSEYGYTRPCLSMRTKIVTFWWSEL